MNNTTNTITCDVLIIGAGMVGLSVAKQLLARKIAKKIIVIEKEVEEGLHTSGKNSGVLHAGIYYKPDTFKAKVCIEGGKRLRAWITERKLPINNCGKIVIPTRKELDPGLDLLKRRAEANGAEVTLWNENEIHNAAPDARSATGRALWCPSTSVVKPKTIVSELKNELARKGVRFFFGEKKWKSAPDQQTITLTKGRNIAYEHLFNCSGLYADVIARGFECMHNYSMIPIRGEYWNLKQQCGIKIRSNIYPVPDLETPFLGVHFTPDAHINHAVSIGPTATPAWGRENYSGLKGVKLTTTLQTAQILTKQYILNHGNIRKYMHEQAFLNTPRLFLKAAQELIPKIRREDIEKSTKSAIRPQLFCNRKQEFVDDFLCLPGKSSTHVLNAISPAFTASFALADKIIEESKLA